MKCLLCGLLFLQMAISLGCFRPRTSFLKSDCRTSYHWPSLYHTGMHNQQEYFKLATDSSCGVLGRGWTTCLLCGGLFFVYVSKWKLVCKFDVVQRNSYWCLAFILLFLAATKKLYEYEWYFLSVCPSVRLSVRLSVCLSVRLSVCPSVTPFWLCSHHRIIMKFSGVITLDQGKVHAKGQGQRSKVKVTEVTTQIFVSGL